MRDVVNRSFGPGGRFRKMDGTFVPLVDANFGAVGCFKDHPYLAALAKVVWATLIACLMRRGPRKGTVLRDPVCLANFLLPLSPLRDNIRESTGRVGHPSKRTCMSSPEVIR